MCGQPLWERDGGEARKNRGVGFRRTDRGTLPSSQSAKKKPVVSLLGAPGDLDLSFQQAKADGGGYDDVMVGCELLCSELKKI